MNHRHKKDQGTTCVCGADKCPDHGWHTEDYCPGCKANPLCGCNCGERIPTRVVQDARSRGKEPLYVDAVHRRRQAQRRNRAHRKERQG